MHEGGGRWVGSNKLVELKKKKKEFHSFTGSCPVFPAPFIEEAVFAPLYITASFVKNKVPIVVRVYFWAFYLVPLVYISVSETVTYCLDDCG